MKVRKIELDITEGRDVSEVLRSYRKNRESFWSQLHLAHLKDQCGTTFLILGIYHEVGDCEHGDEYEYGDEYHDFVVAIIVDDGFVCLFVNHE